LSQADFQQAGAFDFAHKDHGGFGYLANGFFTLRVGDPKVHRYFFNMSWQFSRTLE